jgi:hypothetical protein
MSFDFHAAVNAPFRMQPGLRRMQPGAKHLSVAQLGGRHLLEKLAVLDTGACRALMQSPGFDAQPALATLARQAAEEHPAAWQGDGETAQALQLGWSVHQGEVRGPTHATAPAQVGDCLRRLPTEWRLAGLLSLAFEEDVAIIDGHSAFIPWLAVALPSNWAPADKIGRHFGEVHAPVADNRQLLAAGESLARLVSGDVRWERFVWSISANPNLNAHPAQPGAATWQPGDGAAQAFWRTEHQTFVPVAGHGQAVFTIHVETQALADAIDSADKASRLHDALASMSAAVLRYRGLDAVRERLLQWLASRAAA